MSGKGGGWSPRVVAAGPAGERPGRVVAVETGVVLVAVRSGTLRATFGAELLAAVARDADSAPRPGDRVRLRCWCDDRVTVEQVVARAVQPPG
jgi:ribosome biogenesis GTPase